MKLRLLFVLLPFAAAACVSVRPVVAPVSFIPQQQPELVWVTASGHEGQVIPLVRPTILGDSLHGQWHGTSERVSLHLPRVTSMVARQPDRKRTTLLVAGVGLIAGLVVWRASVANSGQACAYDPRGGWYCPP